MDTSFSINTYDSDGDVGEECILIHVSDTTILKFKDIQELEEFANVLLKRTIPEIKENLL